MGEIHIYPVLGKPSVESVTQLLSFPDQGFLVAFSLKGDSSQQLADRIEQRVQEHHIDSSSSFFSFLNRILEMAGSTELELSAMKVFGDRVVLGVMNGEVWLKRGSKVGRVLSSDPELKMVEGSAKTGDTYVCLTRSASVATNDSLSILLSELSHNIPELATQLSLALDQSGLGYVSAAGLVRVVSNTPDASESTLGSEALDSSQPALSPVIKANKPKQSLKQRLSALHLSVPASFSLKHFLLKPSSQVKKKLAGVVIFIVLVIAALIVSRVHQGIQTSRAQQFITPFSTQLAEIQSAQADDTIATRDKVAQLLADFDVQKLDIEKNSSARKLTEAFRSSVQEYFNTVSGQVELELLPTFYDFRLVRSDFIASRVDVDQNTAVFLDADKQVAISLQLDTKQQTLLPIGQYDALKEMSYQDEKLFLLSDGIYQFRIDSRLPAQKIINEGDSNREGKFIRVFGDFLYVFNPEKRNIYRYLLKEGEISEPIGWFQDKKDLDFSSVSSLSIDGNVWLGTTGGQVLKYERGLNVPFEIQGLPEPFSSQLKVFTKEGIDSVFVLESNKQRVVQLSKDGVFQKEIKSPLLAAVTDVIYSPSTKKGYAVAGSLVYELGF